MISPPSASEREEGRAPSLSFPDEFTVAVAPPPGGDSEEEQEYSKESGKLAKRRPE